MTCGTRPRSRSLSLSSFLKIPYIPVRQSVYKENIYLNRMKRKTAKVVTHPVTSSRGSRWCPSRDSTVAGVVQLAPLEISVVVGGVLVVVSEPLVVLGGAPVVGGEAVVVGGVLVVVIEAAVVLGRVPVVVCAAVVVGGAPVVGGEAVVVAPVAVVALAGSQTCWGGPRGRIGRIHVVVVVVGVAVVVEGALGMVVLVPVVVEGALGVVVLVVVGRGVVGWVVVVSWRWPSSSICSICHCSRWS